MLTWRTRLGAEGMTVTREDEAINIPPGEIAEQGSARTGNAGPSAPRVRVAWDAVVGGTTASNHRDRAVGRCAARRTPGLIAVELRDATALAGRTPPGAAREIPAAGGSRRSVVTVSRMGADQSCPPYWYVCCRYTTIGVMECWREAFFSSVSYVAVGSWGRITVVQA
jgi:hypothetical protein